MKNKLLSFITLVLVLSFAALSASAASYYYDDGTNDDNPNVDKFVPTSGVKIKESKLAGMMENATRNAMDSSKGKKSSTTKQSNDIQPKKQEQNYNSNGRSYKWF